ncbi:MAG: RDD family protein [Actinobacteria bacterium]|nr:RDD family protein [Actinomycetota bacterium]
MREAEGVMGVVLLAVLVALDGERAPVGPLGRLAGTVRDRMLDVVGPDEIVERVDVNAVLDRVDINDLLARVEVNQLLDRVDVDRLLARVDVDRLLADADVNQLLTRVDVDGLMDRVDVERLVRRAGVPEIVAESTTSVAVSTLDLVRRQLLALDVVITRGVMRLLGRDDAALPAGPALLAGDGGPAHSLPVPTAAVTDVTGHYAGPVTRLVAHVLDVAVAAGAFTFTSGALSSLLTTVGVPVDEITRGGVLFVAAFIAWLFLYWWAGTAVAGRTPGMAVVGLRIVTREGLPLSGRRASVRVLVLPLSIALLGLGLIGIVVDRERRGLHDVAAGSTVVYDWGDRKATLPTPLARWLARHAAPVEPSG